MAKKNDETQPYLLTDIGPKDGKKIAEIAKRAKAAQRRKDKAKEQEDIEIDAIRDLIKKSDLKPVDGKIVVRIEGLLITVTPKEDAVKIKEDAEQQ